MMKIVNGKGAKVKLKKLWFIVHAVDLSIPYPKSVDWSVPNRKAGERRIEQIQKNNGPKLFEEYYPGGLSLVEWWCYPKGNAPFKSVDEPPVAIVIDLSDNAGWRFYDPNDTNTVKSAETTAAFPIKEKEYDFNVKTTKECLLNTFPNATFITLPMLSEERRLQIRARLDRELELQRKERVNRMTEMNEERFRAFNAFISGQA